MSLTNDIPSQQSISLCHCILTWWYTSVNALYKSRSINQDDPLTECRHGKYFASLIILFLPAPTCMMWPCCIKFVFERKSEKSNANWFLTNQNPALRTCVWFFWFAFKRKFYATGPVSHISNRVKYLWIDKVVQNSEKHESWVDLSAAPAFPTPSPISQKRDFQEKVRWYF